MRSPEVYVSNLGVGQRSKEWVSRILFACFLLSPVLDWLSYLLNHLGRPVGPVTLMRGLLLLTVLGIGWSLANERKSRIRMASVCLVAAGYWMVHIGMCWLFGQPGFTQDFSNYLKFVQLPLFVAIFWQIQSRLHTAFERFLGVCLVNFWLILIADALAWLTGTAESTYFVFHMGLLGWYHLANAQGIILSLLFPLALFVWLPTRGVWAVLPETWCPQSERLRTTLSGGLFALTAVAGTLRLFYFGTRVSFACLLASLGLLAFLLLVFRKRKGLAAAVVLAFCLIASLLFVRQSPMVQLRLSDGKYAESVQEDLEKQYPQLKTLKQREEVGEYTLEDMRPLYETYVPDLVQTFGLEPVVRAYDGTTDFIKLRNMRTKKILFAELQMQRSAPALRLTGINFNQMILPGVQGSYDLESDWQALYYYNGGVLTAMGVLFFLWVVLVFFRTVYRTKARVFLEPRLWLLGYLNLMLLVAAGVSGSVFRRPSVSIYFAFILAALVQVLLQASKGFISNDSARQPEEPSIVQPTE